EIPATEPATEPAATTPAETQTPAATEPPVATGGKGTTVDGTGGAQAAPDAVASLPLDDYSGLGVSGTVSLVAADTNTTKVTITLTGETITGGHIAHLHPGTCAAPRDEGTIYLADVGPDGVSETTVGIALSALLSDGWIVN